MTPEQWLHITSRLHSLEILAIAVAKVMENQPLLRAEFVRQKEVANNIAIHSDQPDAESGEVLRRLERLELSIWGTVE